MPGDSTLIYATVAMLLGVAKDVRDRSTAAYRDFFDRLVADLRERGVQVPLIAYREGTGFRIIDGQTRYLALLMGGYQGKVPVLVYDEKPDEDQLELAKVQANAMRLDMSDLDYARVYLQYQERHKCGQAELARRLHHDPATVSKRLSVLKNFPEDLHSAIGEGDGKIPFTSAYYLSRLQDIPVIRDLAEKVRDGKLKRDAVEDHVARLLGGKRAKKAKPVKAKDSGASLEFPGEWGWEQLVDWLQHKLDGAKRGMKIQGLPPSAFPSLLKS